MRPSGVGLSGAKWGLGLGGVEQGVQSINLHEVGAALVCAVLACARWVQMMLLKGQLGRSAEERTRPVEKQTKSPRGRVKSLYGRVIALEAFLCSRTPGAKGGTCSQPHLASAACFCFAVPCLVPQPYHLNLCRGRPRHVVTLALRAPNSVHLLVLCHGSANVITLVRHYCSQKCRLSVSALMLGSFSS